MNSSPNVPLPPAVMASLHHDQRLLYEGMFVGAVAYGVLLTITLSICRLLRQRWKWNRSDYMLSTYVFISFTLGTIGNATLIKVGEENFVDSTYAPTVVRVYFISQDASFAGNFCNAVYIVGAWMQDGMLLYRFWAILDRNYLSIIFPSLVFVASIAISCINLAETSLHGALLGTTVGINLTIAYWSMSISMNVILTLAICARLFMMRRHLLKALGEDSVPHYVTLGAMLVESAALYSSFAFILLISYCINSPVQNIVTPLVGQLEFIAPMLILQRVLQGRAWPTETSSVPVMSDIHFRVKTPVLASATTATSNDGSTALEELTDKRPRRKPSFNVLVGDDGDNMSAFHAV